MNRILVIAATGSSSGKTTITMGLARAFRNAGKTVRTAKLGPDYIDPGFHAVASGAPCVNLDLWAMGEAYCAAQLSNFVADITIIEGVMGLFDGPEGAKGSTADFAATFNLPVVLVIDASHQAQSIAALAHGFTTFRNDVQIAGLILNRVKSDRHESLLREALKDAPPILGVLRHNDSSTVKSRHLGLIQAQENQQLELVIESIASAVTRETFLDKMFQIGTKFTNQSRAPAFPPPGQHIAIARDAAFSFIYPHLLQDWRKGGAELSFFSPLNNEAPNPSARFIYLPGGYPELHAGMIANAPHFLKGLRTSQATIYGECGGYMVLGQGLIDAQGHRHAMAGLLPVETSFANRKLHLGYRALTALHGPFPKRLRGHEFHYSTARITGDADPLFEATTANGSPLQEKSVMGQRRGNVLGSYAHIIAVKP